MQYNSEVLTSVSEEEGRLRRWALRGPPDDERSEQNEEVKPTSAVGPTQLLRMVPPGAEADT